MRNGKRLGMLQGGLVVLLACILSVVTSAQQGSSSDDLKKVTASGMIEKNIYSNEHVGFRFALPDPPCDPRLNTKVDLTRASAILLDCQHVVKGWQGMYTLTVAIDYRANYPYLQSLEQYVRSWRHGGEREGHKTFQTEQPLRTAGLDFVESILTTEDSPGGRTFYDGVACTQMKDYLLCFVTSAPSVNEVRALQNMDRRLDLITKSTTK